MIEKLKDIIKIALDNVLKDNNVTSDFVLPLTVERTREERFGDFSANLAMVLASALKMKPIDIAEMLVKNIDSAQDIINRIEIAGPGFINFFMTDTFWHKGFKEILIKGDRYGRSNIGKDMKVLVEFVSANPTGPLHVGHGRGAVVGDVLSNILKASGYDVKKEYYINDRGTQMNTLGKSTWARYQQLLGIKADFPEHGYKGEYIYDIAKKIIEQKGEYFINKQEEDVLPFFTEYSQEIITKRIKNDLCDFGVEFDKWFSEKKLFEAKKVESAIDLLKDKGYIYEKDNALWLRANKLGDEKDRVIVRANGEHTYFAADIAYHKDKFDRGFERVVDIWGADHHGYIPRMQAVVSAMEYKKDAFKVILVQLVTLKMGKEQVSMSTREGKFVPLSDVIKEVGKDAARFFFMMRSSDSHLDFDMNLAKKKSKENPVYYVQYAHARIQSIFNLAKKSDIPVPHFDEADMTLLKLPEEIQLMKQAIRYPEVVENSAMLMEPHGITYYLQDLTAHFHSYYNKHKVISDDRNITGARLLLIHGIQVVIKNAFGLLGIAPMDSM